MSVFREGIANTFRNYFTDENQREYFRLLFRWGKHKRYKVVPGVRFLDYSLIVPDLLTFLGQFDEIFLKQSYNFETSDSDPIIIDCGANIGMSCLYFKRMWPKSRIVAFEADPNLFSILEKNLVENGIRDIQLMNKAVWVDGGPVMFSVEGADGGSIYGTDNLVQVQTIRLKEFLGKFKAVNLLKIDIEGAEDRVILDCAEQLDRVENIFIEYHSWKGKEQRLGEVLAVLESNKFRYRLESTVNGKAPLLNRLVESPMDVHVNIYGFREK